MKWDEGNVEVPRVSRCLEMGDSMERDSGCGKGLVRCLFGIRLNILAKIDMKIFQGEKHLG